MIRKSGCRFSTRQTRSVCAAIMLKKKGAKNADDLRGLSLARFAQHLARQRAWPRLSARACHPGLPAERSVGTWRAAAHALAGVSEGQSKRPYPVDRR